MYFQEIFGSVKGEDCTLVVLYIFSARKVSVPYVCYDPSNRDFFSPLQTDTHFFLIGVLDHVFQEHSSEELL